MSVTAWRARSTASTAAATNDPGSACLPRSAVWLRKTRCGTAVVMPIPPVVLGLMLPSIPLPCCAVQHSGSVEVLPEQSTVGSGNRRRRRAFLLSESSKPVDYRRKRPLRMQQLLKATARQAWARIVPPELLLEFLVAMDDAHAALDMRLGRE